jgi:flagellar basal-body rod protein FlgB
MKTAFDSIDRLEGAMTYHRERHAVLAGNIANLDTPGYRPMDLEQVSGPPDGVALEQTEAGHLAGPSGAAGHALVFDDSSTQAGADGNAVNLEQEMAKLDANRVRYETSSELVSRRFALLKYAAGDGVG